MKATGMNQNYLDKLTIVREKRWEIKYLVLEVLELSLRNETTASHLTVANEQAILRSVFADQL